jgi:hypothetical protein
MLGSGYPADNAAALTYTGNPDISEFAEVFMLASVGKLNLTRSRSEQWWTPGLHRLRTRLAADRQNVMQGLNRTGRKECGATIAGLGLLRREPRGPLASSHLVQRCALPLLGVPP